MKNITIIGAGPCGCLLAIYLAKRGYNLDIYEKRPDSRAIRIKGGRSINLAISKRGLYALEKADALPRFLDLSVPIRGRRVHGRDKDESKKIYAYGRNEEEVNYSISRSALNQILLEAASQYPTIRFHFEHKVEKIDVENSLLQVTDSKNKKLTLSSQKIIATDGAQSSIRASLIQQGHASFALETLDHGYKEILLPKEYSEALEQNLLHIWPRKEFMLMGLANLDGSFTMTLFMPLQGEVGLEELNSEEAVANFFSTYFPDVLALYPAMGEKFLENPLSHLTTVQGGPWYYKDQILLLADAAHAMVPFFGQGINCGFEDCRLFAEFLDKEPMHQNTFKDFYDFRKQDTDAITAMAAENYDEMKLHVAEEDFIFKTHIEKELMRRFPDRYLSRYVLVSYTHQPYKAAQEAGKRQKLLVNKIYEHFFKAPQIDWDVVTSWVNEYLDDINFLKEEREVA